MADAALYVLCSTLPNSSRLMQVFLGNHEVLLHSTNTYVQWLSWNFTKMFAQCFLKQGTGHIYSRLYILTHIFEITQTQGDNNSKLKVKTQQIGAISRKYFKNVRF